MSTKKKKFFSMVTKHEENLSFFVKKRLDMSQFFTTSTQEIEQRVKKCVTICLMSMRLKIELGHRVKLAHKMMENDWT